jgi:hypothetical protein
LRQKHPDTPIIVIQTLIRETGNFNQKARENVKRQIEKNKGQFMGVNWPFSFANVLSCCWYFIVSLNLYLLSI